MNKLLLIPAGLGLAIFAACAPSSGVASKNAMLSPVGLLASGEASKVQGEASILAQGDGQTRIVLGLSGMVAGSKHAAHVHIGACVNGGLVAIALPDVVADANGNGHIEKTIQTGSLPIAAYVNVHQQGSDQGVGSGIACGDIK